MVVIDLFGVNGSGKTTVIRALEKRCKVELPVDDNEKLSYVHRNLQKTTLVWRVMLKDPLFALRLFRMIKRKEKHLGLSVKRCYNLCYRGYFYMFEPDRHVVLGGGLLHRIWAIYGTKAISEGDQAEIHAILRHFRCKKGYYLLEPIEVVRQRLLDRDWDDSGPWMKRLDFIYKNFPDFLKALEGVVEVRRVSGTSIEARVDFLLEDCENLKALNRSG